MRKIGALIRASWLEAASYRVKTLLTFLALLAGAVPFYYIARGLQSAVGTVIKGQGGDYFGFLVVGTVAFACMRTAINVLPTEVGSAISNGTLEALLGTPTRLSTLLAGMVGYAFSWTGVRCAVFVAFAWVLGARLVWTHLPLALAVLLLIILAHLSFGILSAALTLAFKTPGPLPGAVIWVSTFLGGVYYPTEVIPSWLKGVAHFVPLAYGMRPLRQALLEPTATAPMMAADLVRLTGMTVVLITVSVAALSGAMRYARHSGTLAQY